MICWFSCRFELFTFCVVSRSGLSRTHVCYTIMRHRRIRAKKNRRIYNYICVCTMIENELAAIGAADHWTIISGADPFNFFFYNCLLVGLTQADVN